MHVIYVSTCIHAYIHVNISMYVCLQWPIHAISSIYVITCCTHVLTYTYIHMYVQYIHFRQSCQEQRLKRGHYKQSLKKRFVTHACICTLCTYVLHLVNKCILCGLLVAYTKSKYVQYKSLHTKQAGQYSVLWIHSAVFPSTVS